MASWRSSGLKWRGSSVPSASPSRLRFCRRRSTSLSSVLPSQQPELLFHTKCGEHAAVINGGRAAHRPNAIDDFNHGVVLTNRHLQPNEMFEVHRYALHVVNEFLHCLLIQVRLDKLIDKWAGSVEIGVTTHSPNDLDFPSTMTNIR